MNLKLFKRINQFLAELIYAPDTSDAVKKAAKDARRALFRYRDGPRRQRGQLHTMQTTREPRNPASHAA